MADPLRLIRKTTVSESLSFTPAAPSYDQTRGGEARGRKIADALAPEFTRAHPVCDVGMGTGVVALGIADAGFDVYGLDLSHAMLRFARARLGPVAVNANATNIPFRDGAFRQAYSVWVLHVTRDQESVFSEVARILCPGGRYAVVPGTILFDPHPVNEVLAEVQRRTAHIDDLTDTLVPKAERAGFRVMTVSELSRSVHEHSPEQVATALERGWMFHMWGVEDDEWRRTVLPAVEALRALPAADQPTARTTRRQLLVLERR